MAGFIAMISVMIVVAIEMFFATRGAGHLHGSEYDTIQPLESAVGSAGPSPSVPLHKRQESMRRFRQGKIGDDEPGAISLDHLPASSAILVAGRSPSITAISPLPNGAQKLTDEQAEEGSDPDLDIDELDPAADASGLLHPGTHPGLSQSRQSQHGQHPHLHAPNINVDQYEAGSPQAQMSELQEQRKMLLQCLLLEAGILFHSVFIGMALSVATGTSFIVLLVAISFHREQALMILVLPRRH